MTPPENRVAAYRRRVFAERDRLTEALTDVPAAQQRVLDDLLQENADTDFGREHGFAAIRTWTTSARPSR